MTSPNGFFQKPNNQDKQLQTAANFGDSNLDNKHSDKKPNWFKKHPKLTVLYSLMATFVVILLIAAFIFQAGLLDFGRKIADNIKQTVVESSIKANAEEFSLEAENQDSLGVSSDSKYVLKSQQPLTKFQVTENLKSSPQQELEITEKSSTEFEIKSKNAIEAGTIQKFELAIENSESLEIKQNLSWAFGIKNELKITSVLPRNKATGVPLSSGIEIEFNSSQFQSIDSFFEIKPAVVGTFAKYNNRAVFVPNKLEPATLYTVTIRQGVKLEGSNETLKQDLSFQFETAQSGEEDRLFNIFERSFFEFPENTKPSLTVLAQTNSEIATSLYRFNDLGQFLDYLTERSNRPTWALYASKNENYDLAKLQKITDIKLPVKETNFVNYIDYPTTLEKGYYLAVLPSRDTAVIQITSNSNYLSSSNTKTVIWANDLATQKPISVAQIKDLQNAQIAVTGDDGIAFFDTPTFAKNLDKQSYYQLVTPQFTSIIPIVNSTRNSPVNSFNPFFRSSQTHWNYLSLDRNIYRNSDSVNFWGMLKSRTGQNLTEARVELITFADLFNYDTDEIVVTQKNLKLSPVGTFIDKFEFQNLKSGSYEIRVYEPKTNELITTKSLNIQEIIKPLFNISLQPEKEPYLKNQIATFVGKVEFSDGSRVANTILSYSGDSQGEVTTDQNGEFRISYIPVDRNPEFYQPISSTFITVQPKNSQEAEISATSSAGFFPYNTVIKDEAKIENGKGVVNLNYSQLDTSKYIDINNAYGTNFAGKPIPDLAVRATVIAYTYDKVETGSNYNPITKENEKQYNYVRRDIETSTQNLVTGTQGNTQLSFDLKAGLEYQIYVDSKDTDGQDIRLNTYLSSLTGNPNNLDYYTLNQKENTQTATGYSVGEPVNLEIFKNNSIDIATPNDKYLLLKSQNGIVEYGLDIKPNINFNFEEKYIPNINLNGVKFDGKNYSSIENYGKSINFKKQDKQINLEIKTDKDTYAPGEKVKLTVLSKDQDGQPKPSKVNLSVIDESLRYLDPVENNPEDLYNQVSTGINQIYLSHAALRLAADSFGGMGSGGQGVRTNFLDTVYFGEIETNQEGQATVEFSLPDNITTWRITGQSFSSDLFYGLAVKKVVSTKALVVDTILNTTYLQNDELIINLKARGNNLDSNKETTFVVEIPQLKYLETKKAAASGVDFALPKLPVGKYKLILKASLDDLTDSLERNIEVKNSYQNFEINSILEAKNPLALDNNLPETKTILATFGNKVLTQNYTVLQNLASSDGSRLDQVISKQKAQELLNQYFKQDYLPNKIDYSIYQNPETGGLQLLTYSDTDLRLTTMALLLDNQNLNNPKIEQYYNQLSSNRELNLNQYSLVLLGQSLLGKPVLNKIQLLLQKPDLELEPKLNLALAASILGDTQLARKIYNQDILPILKSDTSGQFVTGVNEENTRQLSAVASILGVKLGIKQSYDLYTFVANSKATSNLFEIEQVIFLREYLDKNQPQKASFSYNLDGQNKEINLENGQIHQILVSKQELQNLNLNSQNPDLYVSLNYQTGSNNAKPTETLKITRNYSLAGDSTKEFGIGQIVNVSLKIEIAPNSVLDGCYVIKDYLPSGLRPITNSFVNYQKTGIEVNYPYQINNQELSFCYIPGVFVKPEINYLARVITKGNFTADSSIIAASNNLNIFNLTPKEAVVVK